MRYRQVSRECDSGLFHFQVAEIMATNGSGVNFPPVVTLTVLSRTPVGAQWLSGRVLDSRLRGRGFELHWRDRVVSLSNTQ